MKISLWGHKKEKRAPIEKIVNTVSMIIEKQDLARQKIPRTYMKVIKDHDELLRSLLQRGLV